LNAAPDLDQPTLAIVPSNPAPEGASVGVFETGDKVKLRYATFPKGGGAARGTICLVHGRTEFIEKYFETITDFQSRGFSVATFDWRGQGGSQRLIRSRRLGYVDSFDDYWEDLRSFHSTVLLPDCPPPYYLVGHSMGGLVCLYAGMRDRMMFERMFLTSPMVGIQSPWLSPAGWGRLFDGLSLLGLGQLPVGRGDTDKPPTEASFAGNPVTSDHTRYMRMVDVLKARPDLLVGSPTVRWSAAAIRAMLRAAKDDFPGAIKIPVFMLAAARDEVVLTPAIEQLGLRMRTGRHAMVPAARHELFMENDAIRAQVFAAFDAFITEPST
jgi:lysophospholipase